MIRTQRLGRAISSSSHIHIRPELRAKQQLSSIRLLSTNNNQKPTTPTTTPPSSSVWKSLKAPALFGVGIYLGLMTFGEHQETKQESEYFEGLRSQFWGNDANNNENGHDNKSANENNDER